MGWVGVGTIIATAGYALYHYPPRSWTKSGSPTPPEPISDETPPSPANELAPAKHGADPPTPPSIDTEKDEAQTTPKALASSAPPLVLAVPALNLAEEKDTSDDSPPSRVAAEQSSRQQRMIGPAQKPAPSPSLATAPIPPPQQPSSAPPPSSARSSSLMPPPPVPRLRPTAQSNGASPTGQLQPPRPSAGSSLRPPPSAASGLRVPPSSSSQLSSSTLAPTAVKKPSASSRKVILGPGYSPLDWAARAAKPNNMLRGAGLPPGLLRVTPSMLKTQNGRKGRDAWTSYLGKVYNISPYAPYHPGGKGELLRGAGKDSAQLFQEIHPWVNWDGILSECLVGILVSENDALAENNALDAMD
ncbi:hypothetical protein NUU61_005078 [Penicillium alfredii]|uniref:Cytochrome b5 heme-binding domain-containing protein n=1 Tax=Penicillium alfredii TaxID=1506179 RepID=A0A9W9F952_9EURO|nr:uncharacterized protein NUU61_005078 [Penicillium alfredii]KAJ5095722.1 hypothetical protein NUU61_005078 [Penicillium alfredii]